MSVERLCKENSAKMTLYLHSHLCKDDSLKNYSVQRWPSAIMILCKHNCAKLFCEKTTLCKSDSVFAQSSSPIDLFTMGHLCHSTKKLFEQHHLCRGTTLHRNHFAQDSLCTGITLPWNFFAQKILCTGTTFHRNRFVQRTSMAKWFLCKIVPVQSGSSA